MTASIALAVSLGAAVGAPLRWAIEKLGINLVGSAWPWGTFVVNIVGSFVLGVVLASAAAGGLSPWWVALIATGFCGALTTFSGFAGQILDLTAPSVLGDSRPGSWRGIVYAAASLIVGVGAAALGFGIG
jgi:CrcB protein